MTTSPIAAAGINTRRLAAQLWLGLPVLLAVLAYYFIGIDEGMSSVFGKTLVVHEFVHDARHFLGFPCH